MPPTTKDEVSASPKSPTLISTATIGSKAPIIAVGVEPIERTAYTKATKERDVVTRANKVMSPAKDKEGIAILLPKISALTRKYSEENNME